jgi:hypothetical protein
VEGRLQVIKASNDLGLHRMLPEVDHWLSLSLSLLIVAYAELSAIALKIAE